MQNIKGVTRQGTINVLESYLESERAYYICPYMEMYLGKGYGDAVFEFVTHWVEKLYGPIKHNTQNGYFGYLDVRENSKRREFVEIIVNELIINNF